MVFGLATIGLNGFSMVANHWSNDGMVTIHRYGLVPIELAPGYQSPREAYPNRNGPEGKSHPTVVSSWQEAFGSTRAVAGVVSRSGR